MKYEFRTQIDPGEYLKFASQLTHCNFMQKPMWAAVKSGWRSVLCGLYVDGRLMAASMLLIRSLVLGQKIIYAPRGYLCDFSDDGLRQAFTDGVRAFARKQGAYMVRIDPEIILARRFRDQTWDCSEGRILLEKLTAEGYRHRGFASDFRTYTQPRFNAEFPLICDGRPLRDEEIRQRFEKKARKYVGHYPEERGIFFTRGNGDGEIAEFAAISRCTEDRQHILLRDERYFRRIRDAFGDECMFFFAKMDLRRFLAFLDAHPDDPHTLEDRALAEELLATRGPVISLAAIQMLRSNDTAYLMYSGFNDKVFSRFRTTISLRWEAMRYYRDLGCGVFSFMGIHGDLNDSLSEFKLKFNPVVVEYMGELDLPVRPVRYQVMGRLLPVGKRIYIRCMLRFRRKK